MTESQEWEVLHRDTVAELMALDSAKAILSKKFESLPQSSTSQRLQLRSKNPVQFSSWGKGFTVPRSSRSPTVRQRTRL